MTFEILSGTRHRAEYDRLPPVLLRSSTPEVFAEDLSRMVVLVMAVNVLGDRFLCILVSRVTQ
jgi:hypothetical protein